MNSEKRNTHLIKRANDRVGLFFHIFRLIENYNPSLDKEIRRLLAIVKSNSEYGIDSQWFIERLSEHWKMKITFHIDEIWNSIKNRSIEDFELKSLLARCRKISDLIDFAVKEMQSMECYKNAERFFNDFDLRVYLQTVISCIEDQLLSGEARFFEIENLKEREVPELKIIKIGLETQLGQDIVVIPKFPDLADDDDVGHELRAMGYIHSWKFGRVAVLGWNLPVIKNEAGEFLVPIEQMLAEMGGCPWGYVYDSKERRSPQGYNIFEKACGHCWKKNYCLGFRCIEAFTLYELATNLRIAWLCRNDIRKAIPAFEDKLPR